MTLVKLIVIMLDISRGYNILIGATVKQLLQCHYYLLSLYGCMVWIVPSSLYLISVNLTERLWLTPPDNEASW